jgi:hypothetical protein
MDHVKAQIENGHLCPQLSTRIRDFAIHDQGRSTQTEILYGIGGPFAPPIGGPESLAQLVNDLTDQLETEQTTSQHGQNNRFLPLDKLVIMLDKPNIERELTRHFPEQHDEVCQMVNHICQSEPKDSRYLIMAILTSIGEVASIVHFIEHQVFDSDLPLARHIDNERKNVPLFYRSRDNVEHDKPLDFLHRHWRNFHLESFCRVQYSFFVPFFDMRGDHVNFYKIEDTRIVLPFLKWDKQVSGGYGTVWKAHIHPAHHNYVRRLTTPLTKVYRSMLTLMEALRQ